MNRNENIYNSIQKTNYHRDRIKHRNHYSASQIKYSEAFISGDDKAAHGVVKERILDGSRRHASNFEKKAYWRGVKNGEKRY